MHSRPVSRRSVLLGGAGLALLAACGGGSDKSAPPETTVGDDVLLAFFDVNSTLVSGAEQRAAFGLANADGALLADVPDSVQFTVERTGGSMIGPFEVAGHSAGLPRAYFPLVFTPPSIGEYEVAALVRGQRLTTTVMVVPKEQVRLPGVGDTMPALDTPTISDARGVDPICTREPACPLHEGTLGEALASAKPVAFLVSTPAFCQTAICGPVLEVLLSQQAAFPSVTFLHAEVYASAAEVERSGTSGAASAPVVEDLHLIAEPVLFLVGADGKVAHRFDSIFDQVELRETLQEMTA